MKPADIFKQHGLCGECHYIGNGNGGAFAPCPRLLKALEPPKPSREVLEKIIEHYLGSSLGPLNPRTIAWPLPELLNKIMSWATEPQEKMWCEHMQRGSDGALNWIGNIRFAGLRDDVKFCPACGTPNPAGG